MVVILGRLFFCLPGFAALLALGTDWEWRVVIAVIGVALACLILLGRICKWLALVLMWLAWFFGGVVVAVTFATWPVVAGVCIAIWTASYFAIGLGQQWGEERAARLEARGRGIREWEWVFTGPDYVKDHPLNRLSFGLWTSATALGLASALVLYDVAMGFGHWWDLPLALILAAPIWPILARRVEAFPMVFGAGLAAIVSMYAVLIAIVLPVCVYWVGGLRPNLIYRYRFERMLPKGARDV